MTIGHGFSAPYMTGSGVVGNCSLVGARRRRSEFVRDIAGLVFSFPLRGVGVPCCEDSKFLLSESHDPAAGPDDCGTSCQGHSQTPEGNTSSAGPGCPAVPDGRGQTGRESSRKGGLPFQDHHNMKTTPSLPSYEGPRQATRCPRMAEPHGRTCWG